MMQRSCDGWRGAQRPVWRGNAPKKTGARSARARKRGQNPLVIVDLLNALIWFEVYSLLIDFRDAEFFSFEATVVQEKTIVLKNNTSSL